MHNETIVLTGSHSLLGVALVKTAPVNINLVSLLHGRRNKMLSKLRYLDITNLNHCFKLIKKYRPDLVIHAAALSDVDYCENNKQIAKNINIAGTKNIIKACRAYNAKMVFLSSIAVFDGKQKEFTERSVPHPINYYGRTKLEAEKLVIDSGLQFVIIRLSMMYGWQPEGARYNPVTWIIEKLKNNELTKIVNDVYLNPIYYLDAAKATWKIINKNKLGVYNIGGPEVINRYNWMKEIARVFQYDTSLISPVSSKYFSKKIAKRPAHAILSIKKMRNDLFIQPLGITDGLIAMKKEMNKPL